jgi:hypothetical protein
MATFQLADDKTVALCAQIGKKHRTDLQEAGVKIGILFAYADIGEDGTPKGPAIKLHGHGAYACIKIVPLKDRLTKGYDAEMLIDADRWPELAPKRQEALIHHELTHLMLRGGEKDDLGRPKLKLRKDDWMFTGFREIVRLYGAFAIEHEAINHIYGECTQLELGLPDQNVVQFKKVS